jgi:hypothetical protein
MNRFGRMQLTRCWNISKTTTQKCRLMSAITLPFRRDELCEVSINSFVSKYKSDDRKMDEIIQTVAESAEPARYAVYLLGACGKYPFKFPCEMQDIATLLDNLDIESERDVVLAFGGLQSLNGPQEYITKSLTRLVLRAADRSFTGSAISQILHSLKPLSSNHPATLALLRELLPLIKQCIEPPSAEEVSLAVAGVQRMSHQSQEVRKLIAALVPFINSCESKFSALNVWNMLFGCRNLASEHREVRMLLAAITQQLQRAIAAGGMRGASAGGTLASSLYGLRGMSADVVEVRALLGTMEQLIADSPEQMLTGTQLGNALYGLQKCSTSHQEVSRLVHTLAVRISSPTRDSLLSPVIEPIGRSKRKIKAKSADPPSDSEQRISFQHLSLALYGLKSMSTDSSALRALLDALVQRIDSSEAAEDLPVNGQMFANALYGLQGMECHITAVRRLLKHIASKGWSQSVQAGPQAIANSFFGLKNMSSHAEETRLILRIISQKTEACSEALPAHTCAMAFFGLQGMSCQVDEVKFALIALHSKLSELEHNSVAASAVTMRDAGMIIHGLKGMSSSSSEVRAVLASLAALILRSQDRSFSPSDLSMCLLGLQHMSSEAREARAVLRALQPKLRELREGGRSPHLWCRLVGDVLYGLQGMSSQCEEVRAVLGEAGRMLNDEASGPMGSRAAATALFALQGMDPAMAEVRDVLTALAKKLARLEESIV